MVIPNCESKRGHRSILGRLDTQTQVRQMAVEGEKMAVKETGKNVFENQRGRNQKTNIRKRKRSEVGTSKEQDESSRKKNK